MAEDLYCNLRQLLSQMSGHNIDDEDYVSYFVNDSGEPLIFVQKRGEGSATLLHADLHWVPKPINGPSTVMGDVATAEMRETGAKVNPDGGLLNTPIVGDTMLDSREAQWLDACYAASEHLRGAG
jgi:hypothetical protein